MGHPIDPYMAPNTNTLALLIEIKLSMVSLGYSPLICDHMAFHTPMMPCGVVDTAQQTGKDILKLAHNMHV
jgi:hypothetical protein